MTERTLGRVVLDADVTVPRRDGTALSADVYRPAGVTRSPALLLRLPYDKRRAQSYWYAPPSWYAERGLAVVVEDVRGTHRSAGTFVPLRQEAQDGADLAGWVAEQPWCDGAVGMYGYSYCGLLALLTAAEEAVPLRAIAPAMAPPGLGDGCLHRGGIPAAAFAVTWALELGALRLDRIHGGRMGGVLTAESLRWLVLDTPLPDLLHAADPAMAPWLRHWLAADPAAAYWHTPSHQPAYGRVRAAALHLGGWYDTFRAGVTGHYRQLRAARPAPADDRLVVGPWTHQPARTGGRHLLDGPSPAAWSVDELQLGFFESALHGRQPTGPPVQVAVLNSGDVWAGDGWPPPSATTARWYLTSRGRANSRDGDGTLTLQPPPAAPPDHLVYSHADPVPAVGGDDCGDPSLVGMGPADQEPVERRTDVLVYTAPSASRETVVVGDAAATLFVHSADPASQWLVRVCLVTVAGHSVNLAEGIVRHVAAGPGPVAVEVPIGPVAFRIRPGERLRVHVTQGSSPRWGGLRTAAGQLAVTRSVLLHDPDHPSCLLLQEVT